MSGLKIAGGILSLIGAALVLFMQVEYLWVHLFNWRLIILMILPITALVGGILALVGKRAGGVLALVVGAIWITIAILVNIDLAMSWMDYLMVLREFSFFYVYLDFTLWHYVLIEIVLVLVGGILAVAGGKD